MRGGEIRAEKTEEFWFVQQRRKADIQDKYNNNN